MNVPSTGATKARRAWALLAGMGIGVLLLVPVFLLPRGNPTRALLLATYISVWPAEFISILMHEAGHAIAAVFVGFRLFAFTVTPMQFRRVGNRWKLSYWAGWGMPGFISAFPVSANNVRKGLLAITIAGPAALLVTGLAVGILAWFVAAEWSVWLRGLLYMTAIWSLIGGVVGFLPIRRQHMVSDGVRIGMLMRGGPEADRECSLLLLAAASVGGQRPRAWDADLMRTAAAEEAGAGPNLQSSQAVQYNWLIDTGQIEKAGQLLAVIVENEMPPPSQAIWQLQMAWFKAFYQRDLEAACDWSGRVSLLLKFPEFRCARLKTDAAIALLEERWHDAQTAARGALQLCDELADPGVAVVIREKLGALLEQAESQTTVSAALPTPPTSVASPGAAGD